MDPKTLTVIVADDEDHIRLLLKTVIRKAGHECVGEAVDGVAAVALYREKRPDLMLLDVNMPGKTGDDALSDILAEFPAAHIVMLTSVADVRTVKACIEKGAVDYVRKDTPVNDIIQFLEHIGDTL